MKSKSFKQEIADLENGLKNLERIRNDTTKRNLYRSSLKNIEIQKERIDFLKRGYALAKKEFF